MAMTDLIPWKKSNDSLAVRQEQTDPFMRLRHNIDQVFDNILGDWTGRMNKFDRAFIPTIDVHETAKEIRVTAEKKDRRDHASHFDHEHHGIGHHLARIQLQDRIPKSSPHNLPFPNCF